MIKGKERIKNIKNIFLIFFVVFVLSIVVSFNYNKKIKKIFNVGKNEGVESIDFQI